MFGGSAGHIVPMAGLLYLDNQERGQRPAAYNSNCLSLCLLKLLKRMFFSHFFLDLILKIVHNIDQMPGNQVFVREVSE